MMLHDGNLSDTAFRQRRKFDSKLRFLLRAQPPLDVHSSMPAVLDVLDKENSPPPRGGSPYASGSPTEGFVLRANMKAPAPISAQLKELEESTQSLELEVGNPLIAFAEAGNLAKVSALLTSGEARIDQADNQGWTALIAAASEGQVEVVNFLLTRAEDAAEVVNAANHDDETALIRATLGGHVDVVRALLATDGINVNAATSNGTTALMVAAGTDNEEIATELLVADGISVNAEDVNGKTALQHAIDRGNRGVATLIQTIMDAFDVDD
jgi:ankyrin repeat protein